MKLTLPLFLVVLLLFCDQGAPCNATDYRIQTQAEFDAINAVELLPGDAILLERGRKFSGMLAPSGNGTIEGPIRIQPVGEGARPRIDAGGKEKAGLLLANSSYVEVSGLEITNTDGSDKDQGNLYGIYVIANGEEGIRRHVYIDDCHVHDVNGKVAGKKRGGIHVHVRSLKSTIFDDLRITNNRIVNVGGVGIGNDSSCGRIEFRKQSTRDHHLWTQVYVAGNYVDHTGRNNIIARCSKDAIYERNVLANSSRYDTGHSIFCFNTNGIKIQFNEAYGNIGESKIDRGGFDADYNCVNTFIQYNYSHDNQWFCGIMKRRNRHVVIRYNISQNEREGLYFYGFETARQAKDIHIYNNTHFVREGLDVEVFPKGRTPLNSTFENNLFFFAGKGTWGKNPHGINTKFQNNHYFNLSPHESDGDPLNVNPSFTKPGKAGKDIDLTTMADLRGYQLRKTSPCIDRAVSIVNNGGRDILGTRVGVDSADMGAVERQP
ncbi:right-handed parallel beta-helix repeat-containing protein [Adhaeretor mobilis]|uniref:right-handed parallel beta-helix repeat-containing protein n=1 Tax=Adhaeretor mobilis TaxID=1930276 RepID=UPI001FE862C4|nr:right-handed parallel beta-helix repeat-containing protein [Adhaeretor mobilis]